VPEGYKAPEKKELSEIMAMDAGDDSLAKYKASLLGPVGKEPFPTDPRNLIVEKFTVFPEGREPFSFDPNKAGFRFTIKEGTPFTIEMSFYVQRDIVAGLKYLNLVYKLGVRVDKTQTSVGSYGPSDKVIKAKVDEGTAPSGMLGRGSYQAKAKLVDDDKNTYLDVEYAFEVKKDWE